LAQGVSILAFIPIGMLSSRIGRRRMILVGVLLLGASFGTLSFLRVGAPLPVVNLLFSIAGIGWSTINVNSFPMVVELCHAGDVGKYTGYYYTASMAAQTLTPILSGLFLDGLGMHALFPYGFFCIALAFVTMLLVRHGDAAQVKQN
jgi:MFS family permease